MLLFLFCYFSSIHFQILSSAECFQQPQSMLFRYAKFYNCLISYCKGITQFKGV
jgi:hypothetical protein